MAGAVRVMVLNVDVGAGHRRAGEALCAAIEALRPGSQVRVGEVLDYLGPGAGKLAKDLYLGVQSSLPDLWGALYEQRDLFNLFRPLSQLVDGIRAELSGLLPVVLRFNPHLLVATHPMACGLGAALRRGKEIDAPLAAVLTDLDGHPAWVVEGVDLYLAPTPKAARDLERHGARAVVDSGIPLRPAFAEIDRDQGAARRRLGLPTGRFTVLLLGGGLGLGPIVETAEALLSLEGPLQLVLLAGANQELRQQADALARRTGDRLQVLGHIENVADYMAAADIAVGKPGGMTCAELLALGVPLLALRPLAGQEEANCAVLLESAAAVKVESAEEARLSLAAILRHPQRLQHMRMAAERLGRPGSARAGARRALGLLG